ncbi:MAG TPA: HipA N-terminal domain-containing protein [Niastella sp.]
MKKNVPGTSAIVSIFNLNGLSKILLNENCSGYIYGKLDGILSKHAGVYRLIYDKNYLATPRSRPVSTIMPFQEVLYESDLLFPVFVNMLSGGSGKALRRKGLFQLVTGDDP